MAEVDKARLERNVQLLTRIVDDPAGAADMALLLYVATVGAQLITSGSMDDADTASRIERLIVNLVLEWHKRGGGELLPG